MTNTPVSGTSTPPPIPQGAPTNPPLHRRPARAPQAQPQPAPAAPFNPGILLPTPDDLSGPRAQSPDSLSYSSDEDGPTGREAGRVVRDAFEEAADQLRALPDRAHRDAALDRLADDEVAAANANVKAPEDRG